MILRSSYQNKLNIIHALGDIEDTTITKTPRRLISNLLRKWELKHQTCIQLGKSTTCLNFISRVRTHNKEEMLSGGSKLVSTRDVIVDTGHILQGVHIIG